MASYYSQVEEAIKTNEQELKHLNEELRGLRSVEQDTPRESYQRQYAQILYHIDQEQRRLEQNQRLLESYNSAKDAISELRTSRENKELVDLRELLSKERDPQIRREISEEIEAKEKEHETRITSLESTVTSNMSRLTDELATELRNSFLESDNVLSSPDVMEQETIVPSEEPKIEQKETSPVNTQEETVTPTPEVVQTIETEDLIQTRLQNDYDKASKEYDEARRQYAESIAEFQRIFTEERTRREQEGPFPTEEELDAFTADYMRQKLAENEKFQDASRRMNQASRRMTSLEQKLKDHALEVEKATSLDISVEDYAKIKKTVERRDILSAIYEKKGLGEVNRRTKAGKDTAKEVSEEAISQIIESVKNNKTTNIIDAINITYGTDLPVRNGDARQTVLTPAERENVAARQKVRVRQVSHTGEQKDQEPVKGPPILTEGAKQHTPSKVNSPSVTPIKPENNVPLIETKPVQNTVTNPSINLIPRGMNPDGTYRLLKEDIIQDDLATRKPAVNQPTGISLAPVTSKPTGMVPYGTTPTIVVPPTGEKTPTNKPIQSGETPSAKPIPVVEQPPVSKITPPKKDDEQIIDVYTTTPPITTPTQTPPVVTPPKKEKPKRGLLTIIDGLTDGLDLGKKDGKRLKASNIKCIGEFREELSSGNYLYNIVHLVPAISKLPFKLLQKVSGKIMLSAEAKENASILKERLSKLPEEDLMTLYTEYRGNRVVQERFPTVFNTLLDERMQQFAMSKVTSINTELEERYSSAFSAIKQLEAIDHRLADKTISSSERTSLQDYRKSLLRGQAENIKSIRQGYIDANGWLSGGSHGFSEDMKASATKLSVVGKRFAKDHDLDNELLHKQAQLERAEMKAIADGNDEMALRVFVQAESLLSANTEIKGSVFGNRSTGKKYYSPLAEQLDYRDDPFIRDLFTTIALTSATISTVKNIAQDQSAIMAENQKIMEENNQIMDQVNQMGADIAGKREVMMEGMQSQGMSDTLAGANEIERAVLDKTGWSLGTSAYRTADNAGHTYYTDFYTSAKASYENIAQQYASGSINQAQAMELIADLTTKTHETFGQINEACLEILKPYAQNHPQFDLSGVQGAMEYLQQNPEAISAMNQAMVDVTNAGDVLASLQLKQLTPLTTLPSTLRTTIINAAATAALATNISNGMSAKKHEYGNEVTEMVEEYVESQNQQSSSPKTQTK